MTSNLMRRFIVAAVGIPLLLFSAIAGGWLLSVVIVVLQAVAIWEWQRLCHVQGAKPRAASLILGTLGLDAFVLSGGHRVGGAVFLIAICALYLLEVFRNERRPLRDLPAVLFFIGFIALPFALWSQFGISDGVSGWEPLGALAALFIATWLCDTAAYFVGRQYGRHKLYPAASPNKTVEGFIAGVVASAITLPVLALFHLVQLQVLDYVAMTVVVGLAGQLGDLLESLMKREVQVKDTSALLPGHGGVLDRFDSIFLSSPLLFAYLILGSG